MEISKEDFVLRAGRREFAIKNRRELIS